jgi:hypothetical protein
MALKTNFTDDILAESMNGKRQYNVTKNSNGTKSLEDVTDYQSVGSIFSAKDMNETNAAVNQAYDDMGDEFNKNTKYLAGAVKIHNNKLWKFKVDHDPGEWDESQVRKTTLLDEIGELTEKMAVEFGSFNPSNTSIIIIQGSPIIIKYGKICYVHMILSIKQYLNTGDIIGDISFKPNSDITNIPIYTEGTNQQSGIHAFSLYSTGQIKAFSSMPEGGYIFDIMYEVA